MMISVTVEVFGRVQGVGFRYFVLEQARALGLTGFVKNLPNGNVYIEAEGDPLSVEQFMHLCEQGPARARVSRCLTEEQLLKNFKDFCIK
jgi:acylphosphatase